MNVTLRLDFVAHQAHVEAGLEALAAEVLDDLREVLQANCGQKVSVSTAWPNRDEPLRHDALGHLTAARLFSLHVTVEADHQFDMGTFVEELDKPKQDRGPGTILVNQVAFAMDDLLAVRLLASNIAAPGVMSMTAGALAVDGLQVMKADRFSNDLIYHLIEARRLGWPKEVKVSYAETLAWVSKVFASAPVVGNSRVSRALAAFSQVAIGGGLIADQLDLFWAMMGLEALYCEGKEGLKKQLFDKASVIFGPIVENKKRIRKLYDFRSDFIHGSLHTPYSFRVGSNYQAAERFDSELYESESIAYLLLTASLQFLVKNGLHDVEFTYKLRLPWDQVLK